MKVYTKPFRVGRKQKRAVLDALGNELVIFPRGMEESAQEYCDFLNGDTVKQTANPTLEQVESLVKYEVNKNHTDRWGVLLGNDCSYLYMNKDKNKVLEWLRDNYKHPFIPYKHQSKKP